MKRRRDSESNNYLHINYLPSDIVNTICNFLSPSALYIASAYIKSFQYTKYILRKGEVFNDTVEINNYELVELLEISNVFKDESIPLIIAAKNGNKKIITFLLTHEYKLTSTVACYAARYSHNDLVKWLLKYKCPYNSNISKEVARSGSFMTLKWLYDRDYELSDDITQYAAESGNLFMLKWLRKHVYAFNENTGEAAVISNNISMITWLYAKGCIFDYKSYLAAIVNNNIDVIKWLHSINCSVNNWSVFRKIGEYPTKELLKWTLSLNNELIVWTGDELCYHGHYEMLQYYIENGGKVDGITYQHAAKGNQLPIVQLLRNHNYEWDMNIFQDALQYADCQFLDWIFENKCPISNNGFEIAIKRGNLDIIQWVYNHKFTLPDDACKYVNNLPTLQWLRAYNCQWHNAIYINAIEYFNLEMMIWAHTNGCPIDINTCLNHIYSKDDDELYLYSHILNWLYNLIPLDINI